MYKCANCGIAVIVIEGKIIKVCNCNSGVIAELSATATGKSTVK